MIEYVPLAEVVTGGIRISDLSPFVTLILGMEVGMRSKSLYTDGLKVIKFGSGLESIPRVTVAPSILAVEITSVSDPEIVLRGKCEIKDTKFSKPVLLIVFSEISALREIGLRCLRGSTTNIE